MAIRLKRRLVGVRANYPTGKPRQHAEACKHCGQPIPRNSRWQDDCSDACHYARFGKAYRQ